MSEPEKREIEMIPFSTAIAAGVAAFLLGVIFAFMIFARAATNVPGFN